MSEVDGFQSSRPNAAEHGLLQASDQVVQILIDILATIDLCDNHEQYLVPDLIDDAVVCRMGNLYLRYLLPFSWTHPNNVPVRPTLVAMILTGW